MIAMRVVREPSDFGATLGALYINDFWVCWTLEDAIRERPMTPGVQPAVWVAEWKVKGRTAIPAGRYQVVMEYSPRFDIVLPELKGVPGFSETKFHAGNDVDDTDGCILVGRTRQTRTIGESRIALDHVLALLKSFNGAPIFVDVENPPGRHLAPHTPGERLA